VSVADKLTSLPARRSDAEAIDYVVQSTLETNQQLRTGDTLGASCALEGVTELLLEHSVRSLYLLLLSQLDLEVRESLAPTSVLTWTTFTLLDRTLSRIATLALEEELLPLTTTQATNCSAIPCHDLMPLSGLKLNATTLTSPATVVRNRGDILDQGHLEPCQVERSKSGFTA
jgi:hypothetical protein